VIVVVGVRGSLRVDLSGFRLIDVPAS
jgi:hypothetical protein